ncbi:MAG: GNAT family N-acetyltransferase [Anaerolineae bacterium]|nr:GNAT family N-acetyltransferase [Anaerolineae bacterium]
MSTSIHIRPLLALTEMYAAVDLQKSYWGDDLESVIPAHMLFSLATHGGHVLAAFERERIVGVLVGFLGTGGEDGRPAAAHLQVVSKRMVVLPGFRGHGLGYSLKMAQRDLAVQQGLDLVTWTFDPLLAANAHLNLRKLGAICRQYLQNYYGEDDRGGLTVLGSSDRLFVEWGVTDAQVNARAEGSRLDKPLRAYLDAGARVLNPTTAGPDHRPRPAERIQPAGDAVALLEIPVDFRAILQADEALALAWQMHVRDSLQSLLREKYVITDFVRETYEGRDRAFYVLSRDAQFDFNQN